MTKRSVRDMQRPFVMIDAELISVLSNAEFKIYAQIKRRAGQDGECWESLDHMAKETGNSVNTLKRALKSLKSKGLILKTKRVGETDLYELTTPDQWHLIGQNELPNIGQNELGDRPKRARGVGQNELPNIGQNCLLIRSPIELDPIEVEKRRETPLPHKKIEAAFAIEQTPWMAAGDLNAIDPGFVAYVQDALNGRGVYESRKPTEAEAKNHIRQYMSKPRGSEERMMKHAAILDKWQAFMAQGESPEAVKMAFVAQMDRLGINGVIVPGFESTAAEVTFRDLSSARKVLYVKYLQSLEVRTHAAA